MTFDPNQNPYQGINAHLNSELQTPGTEDTGLSIWPGFHSSHVANIADFLNDQLPPNYVARSEQSLQIRVQEDVLLPETTRKPEPDVSIYQRSNTPAASSAVTMEAASPVDLALDDTLDLTEDFVKSIIIRQVSENDRIGVVVTRIELLSPTNKPGHAGYDAYRRNRNTALFSHVPLVEVDYLHELPPPLLNYPIYPLDPYSQPYNILVSDPRPSVKEGRLRAYGFHVDQSFPIVTIPLAGDDTLNFDFGAVYRHTFARGRWGYSLNYAAPPPRFDTYHPLDRARIEAVMARVQAS
jgi:hypothetical protein